MRKYSLIIILFIIGITSFLNSCEKDYKVNNEICVLNQMNFKKPSIERIFEKRYEYDKLGNLIKYDGYQIIERIYEGYETINYEYNAYNNLVKIVGVCHGPYNSESNYKVYKYNSANQIIERKDSSYKSSGFGSFEWEIKKFNFNYSSDSISGMKFSWDVDFDLNNNVVYVPKDTAFFSLTRVSDLNLNFQIYNSDLILIANETIEYIFDDKNNSLYNPNISINELYYFLEQSFINKDDNYKMPYLGDNNIISLIFFIDDSEVNYSFNYEYNEYGYPEKLELNGYSFEYIYEYD